jgi:hypothetical protein
MKSKKTLLFIGFFCLNTYFIFSQSNDLFVKGYVVDSVSGERINGVSVINPASE